MTDKTAAEIAADNDKLRAALIMMTEHYVNLVGCGDCGNWDPEKEHEVIMARAILTGEA